jgi:hypothetical protein
MPHTRTLSKSDSVKFQIDYKILKQRVNVGVVVMAVGGYALYSICL